MANFLENALLSDAREVAGNPPWPARWYRPTENAQSANPTGSIGLAAAGWQVILNFTVPRGFRFVVESHWHSYAGTTAFIEGSGALVFALFVNPTGAYGQQRAVADMGAMLTSRGGPSFGPWPLRSCLVFEEGAALSYQVNNVSQKVDSSTFASAGLHGRLEPMSCGTGATGPGTGNMAPCGLGSCGRR